MELEFEAFVAEVEPLLRRAYLGTVGADRAPGAVGEALAFAWQEWSSVSSMSNPVGYLYRVGVSRTRSRKAPGARARDGKTRRRFARSAPAAAHGSSPRVSTRCLLPARSCGGGPSRHSVAFPRPVL